MNDQAQVFVVDDDPAVRDALTLLLELEGLPVTAFDSAEAFLAANRWKCRGCVIVDVRMPGMDGVRLQEEIAHRDCALPVIFLTAYGDIPMTVRAMKAGAVDFLTKPVTSAALMQSVRAALAESERLQAQAESNHVASRRLSNLTQRERQVMALAVEGHANKEIARRLGISHRTVEIHRGRIMQKTGTHTLIDLARIAQESGLR
ncbi:MAG: two component transcriptional regulator, LuxR family [Rhodocyclaceae bacterium]|nr:two component transcriptional regulator, LuxR family [Rhodocyclaceae bacterium]